MPSALDNPGHRNKPAANRIERFPRLEQVTSGSAGTNPAFRYKHVFLPAEEIPIDYE